MYLLKEITQHNVNSKIITEDVGGVTKKKYFIEGVFAQSDIKNRNGRIYPKTVMNNEISRYINENVLSRRAYGELNHPESFTINMDKVSHLITELNIDDTNVIGKAQVLDTPMGKIVQAIIDAGGSFGVSTRAVGSVRRDGNGTLIVEDDFNLSAIDIVADPSAPDAFVAGLVECKDWLWNRKNISEPKLAEMKKSVKRATKKQLNEKHVLKLYQKFMRELANR